MEIGKKIMEFRKKNGFSQEELADKIGVTRQTISKWELGETSPDIKQAKELSKIFKISLDELVDNDIENILIEKTSNTEKLAGLILKSLRFLIIFIIATPILVIILNIVVKNIRENTSGRFIKSSIECTLHDKKYYYEFEYFEETGQIKTAGGDGYLANITNIDKESDAYVSLDKINAYVENNGGTCKRSEPVEVKH